MTRLFLYSRADTIYGGSNEIQRNVIGEQALGLPKEPQMTGHKLLDGKVVLVTAAAGTGIGFATAKRCVEEGAQVVISDMHERRLGESAAELGVHSVLANVTVEDDVQRLVDETVDSVRSHRRA